MSPSRRSLLKLGLGGSLLLAAAGLGLGLQPSLLGAAPPGLKVLDLRAWSVLSAVAETMCPAAEGRPGARDIDVAALIDGTLDRMHPADAQELVQLLMLLENGLAGMLFDGRPRPFTRLSPDGQAQALDAWRTSQLLVRRQGFKALRGLVMAAYWGHPRLYDSSGYPGPPDFGQARAGVDDFAALVARGKRRIAGQPEPVDETPTTDGAEASP